MASKSLSAQIQEMVRKELENQADRAKRALVRATKEAMTDYYSVPEGKYYDRTGMFGKAYKEYEHKDTRDKNHMSITVGVVFENPPVYEKHGIPLDDIYASNLSGEHGGNGNQSADILERVNAVADKIAGK